MAAAHLSLTRVNSCQILYKARAHTYKSLTLIARRQMNERDNYFLKEKRQNVRRLKKIIIRS